MEAELPDVDANMTRVEAFCTRAAALGADIATSPEMFSVGCPDLGPDQTEAMTRWRSLAGSVDGPWTGRSRSAAFSLPGPLCEMPVTGDHRENTFLARLHPPTFRNYRSQTPRGQACRRPQCYSPETRRNAETTHRPIRNCPTALIARQRQSFAGLRHATQGRRRGPMVLPSPVSRVARSIGP